MSRRGRTRKPCNGCGQTVERAIDDICRECERIMSAGKAAIEAENRVDDRIFVFHTDVEHWIVRARVFGSRLNHLSDEIHPAQDEFDIAWRDLTNAVLDETVVPHHDAVELISRVDTYNSPVKWIINGETLWGDSKKFGLVKPIVRKSLNTLVQCFAVLFELAYRSGFEEGTDVLKSLHDGQITVGEFDSKRSSNRAAAINLWGYDPDRESSVVVR